MMNHFKTETRKHDIKLDLKANYFCSVVYLYIWESGNKLSFDLIVHLELNRSAEIHTSNDAVMLLCCNDNTDPSGLFLFCRVDLHFSSDNNVSLFA